MVMLGVLYTTVCSEFHANNHCKRNSHCLFFCCCSWAYLSFWRGLENSPLLSGNYVKPTHTAGVSLPHAPHCKKKEGGKTEGALRDGSEKPSFCFWGERGLWLPQKDLCPLRKRLSAAPHTLGSLAGSLPCLVSQRVEQTRSRTAQLSSRLQEGHLIYIHHTSLRTFCLYPWPQLFQHTVKPFHNS